MTYGVDVINQVDPEVASAIQAEVDRRRATLSSLPRRTLPAALFSWQPATP